ncbi:unnamed protein product [Acanthoscelides obtectus]|uniref:Uncharacterized protein n=1 Tax=Acanthoscelides obtectus TaxID=200917 RepID=A0A9P0P8Y7_ACAOB|nr:unnamed protein product [Acanthoscelides obtectus]CAK1668810.1 hypothetical protein AOBTE_LOCUS26618 [Acanthoscelides obtectus]
MAAVALKLFSCQRFPDRYTPVQNLGSLDRYHTYTTLDRYCRTATPTDIRYHTLSTDKHSTGGRYTPVEKYQGGTTERHRHHHTHHQSAQNVCFAASESRRRSNGSKQDVYKVRERSSSSDRKDRQDREDRQASTGYHRLEQYVADRFPTIPCPERFATKEKPDHLFSMAPSSTPSSYLEPPSPAPVSASERRFAPPAPPSLSPDHAHHEDSTPSPDCFANNAFPSPTAQGGLVPAATERFAPPPPLSPSPTEQQHHHHPQRYAPAVSPKKLERYEKRYHHHQPQQQQQQQTATSATTTTATIAVTAAGVVAVNGAGERFSHKDRYQNYSERYPSVSYHTDKFVHNDTRYNSNPNNSGGERYIPPNAHTPVERYIPQPQEPYYGSSYQGYQGFKYSNSSASDPYMRRDLAYHYRLSLPYNGSHYQRVRYMGTPNRMKCCQLQDYQLSKSSPGSSSSSSSVTSRRVQ